MRAPVRIVAALRAPSVMRSGAPTISFISRSAFSTTRHNDAPRNRIYPQRVRSDDELQTLILLSASSRVPLITLWRTQWGSRCNTVAPLIRELVETDGIGAETSGNPVSFVEVEIDAPDVQSAAERYAIHSVPTLLAFDRSEPQFETRVTKMEDLGNRRFLIPWIENEAARKGEGGGGGLGWFGSLGKWFK